MSNNNGLVDEFERLQNLKKEIDEKIASIKERIIGLAKEKNIDIIFGTNKKCSVKEYKKVVYPSDKTVFTGLIKEKGLYDKFSSINYFKLNPAILKGEIDNDILMLIRTEKAFRISLKDKEN
ncbi:MAG: hypothetical protein ABIB79_00360 [archaeon]